MAEESEARRRGKDPWPPVRPGLGAWWRDHLRISRETVHFVSARLGTSLLVWLLVGIALALPAGLFLIQQNLSAMTAAWDGRPGLTAYFQLDAGADKVENAVTRLEAQAANRRRRWMSSGSSPTSPMPWPFWTGIRCRLP